MIIDKLSELTFTSLNVGHLQGNHHIGCIELNRPEKSNSFEANLWEEFPKAVRALDEPTTSSGETRVIVICGAGKNFCAGIDLNYLKQMFQSLNAISCPGRLREAFRRHILKMQDCFSCLEQCRVPVIAAVHGSCVGGGVDLIASCDMRFCSSNATFCVKELDVGIVADLGSLQRLPRIVGHGMTADLALTARSIDSIEAHRIGLVSQVVSGGEEEVIQHALQVANLMAKKSPLAMRGTKHVLLHSRDCTVNESLQHVAVWNSAQLISDDIKTVLKSLEQRKAPVFSKL
ncbi:hypothetical protein CEUSTIGMA_g10129.t1 [Chlamydomonas eustigma]|uniref:Enoyl-CoA hydratase n=1 Tax=Chlamydomonas eustigma TaxID=1157962 RepID=A0A250XI33_9CHLO|nr:hypothetical protein CEUSTIGMA_g10129.t1 [Chlamydomonas eustigma]|eukprot:GAX82703.1 hypothetical protein CEUSTIGMA_g10129.t1 [Chlamydomonas eustigma]